MVMASSPCLVVAERSDPNFAVNVGLGSYTSGLGISVEYFKGSLGLSLGFSDSPTLGLSYYFNQKDGGAYIGTTYGRGELTRTNDDLTTSKEQASYLGLLWGYRAMLGKDDRLTFNSGIGLSLGPRDSGDYSPGLLDLLAVNLSVGMVF